MIPESQVLLFANMTEYNLSANKTETRSSERIFTLNSLLDFSSETTYESNGVQYRQIPFLSNSDGTMVILHDERDSYDINCAMPLRKYYIQAVTAERKQEYVATMIPQSLNNGEPEFDFLHKAGFSGIVLFSKLDGHLFYTKRYVGGHIQKTEMVRFEDFSSDLDEETTFFSILTPGNTRALFPWLIPFCGGFHGGTLNTSVCTSGGGGNGNGAPGNGPSGNGGVTNGNGAGGYIYLDVPEGPGEWEDEPPLEPMYIVWVQSNVPQHVAILGSDFYSEGSWCQIDEAYINGDGEQFSFVAWAGDLQECPPPPFHFRVYGDVCATALYSGLDNVIPCWDQNNGKWNPMTEMVVAPIWNYDTKSWDYRKGIYGKGYRVNPDGTPKWHKGIDIQASLGTPVYAICDGVVERARSGCPDGFQGQTSGWTFGNEIRIKGSIGTDEQLIIFQYAHLNYENPIAINPRFGVPFKEGDPVYAGELIGYTGNTGNAYNCAYPHLHFGAKLPGSGVYDWIDPSPYINASYDVDTINSENGVMSIFRCDNGILIDNPVPDNLVEEEDENDDQEEYCE